MNKLKIIGLSFTCSAPFVWLILFTLTTDSEKGISNIQTFLLVCGFILFFLGIGLYNFAKANNARTKYVKYSLPIHLVLIAIGITFKIFHFPGASIITIISIFSLCFTVFPIMAKNRYNRWSNFSQSSFQIIGLMISDSLGLTLLLLGMEFKLMHWPLANLLMILGIVFLILSFFLWQKKFEQLFKLQIESGDKLKEQHKEIVDSINYAKRIQSAILPPIQTIKNAFQEAFVLYKPKDIVAGDFYWLEKVGNTTLIAVADCTGHGVPGALVSVVCNNALNRSVREFKLTDPGKILTKTREIILSEFEKSNEEVKDGMDITLCAITGNKIKFSGAYNPLWIIRKNTKIVEEIKVDKQPVGLYHKMQPFNTFETESEKGDVIYIFSDGFSDQFGGEKGKKFKSKNFKTLLCNIVDESMENQKIELDSHFESWRGGLEQIDDVCVIGIKF